MTRQDLTPAATKPNEPAPAVERLLFIADAAVADTDELPAAVRAVVDAAAELYVVTPTLPGRLAWLADDVDRSRHIADMRLDAVLDHMRSIGAHATGRAARGSVMTVIADAVEEFTPDHILIALRSSEHANWQERKLIAHVEERFGLPVTTYAVDLDGRTSIADGPLILCYDGSEGARDAIQHAGELLGDRRALVVTVWRAAERGQRLAEEGVRIARGAGLQAEPLPVKHAGTIWETIVEVADRHDAATIVMGSRGVTGLRAMGSVSSAVVHHADRPTLIVRRASVRA